MSPDADAFFLGITAVPGNFSRQIMEEATILVVDDDPTFLELLTDVLQFENYTVHCASGGKAALDFLASTQPDLVLLDLSLPDIDGLEVLKRSLELYPGLAVVMISGQGTIKRAVEATRLGALDFLEKPIESQRVLLTVKNILTISLTRKAQVTSQQQALQKYGLIAASPEMQRITSLIDIVAATRIAVHISGESGTGKELVARALHFTSNRKNAPFVQVNCAAIPETLIESELFGYEKGAFTDARMRKKGYFQQADGGTLFLDEIGDLSLAAQAKILRALESNEVQRIGAEKPEKIDIRLITASNKNLQALVDEGAFRDDLYYRINGLPVRLLPLRERQADIFPLAQYFMQAACRDNNIPERYLGEDCKAFLHSQPWRGNARELKNFIEKIAVITESRRIDRRMLQLASTFPDLPESTRSTRETLRQARAAFERDYILATLNECNGNITKTAALLGIERTHLYKKMKDLGIKPG